MALLAFATLAYAIATVVEINNFLAGARTVEDAASVINNSLLKATNVVAQMSNLPLAAGFILLIALNAMRVGLLNSIHGRTGNLRRLALYPAHRVASSCRTGLLAVSSRSAICSNVAARHTSAGLEERKS